MKILYACQATGNGHVGRARVMAAAFAKHNIQVDWLFSGGIKNEFFDMQPFGDYKCYSGLSFIIRNNRLRLLKTLFSADMLRFYKDIKAIDFGGYDLLINDFEPVTAWAAKKHKIKSISLSHQSAFLYDIPHSKPNILFDLFMKYYAPSKLPIGIHWQPFNPNIIPPIIAKNLHSIAFKADEIVVYLPFHSTQQIVDLLRGFKHVKFHIFHKNSPRDQTNNLTFYPYSLDEFNKKVATCGGIISNAGFELPSEALQLGKKLLLEPIHGQFEQVSNANMLAGLKWAGIQAKITPHHIENWLKNGAAKQVIWPDVADEFAKWIKTNKMNNLPKLSKFLWEQVSK